MNDTVCECCEAPFHSLGGITTTLGYVCYECVAWIHQVAKQTKQLAERPMRAVLQDIDNTE